jgi:hypothetical protein
VGSARIAFLPTTPLLMPDVATGAAGDLDTIRHAARRGVDLVCRDAGAVAVLVPGHADHPLDSWSLSGYGVTVGAGRAEPLPVAIAGWLLAGRPAHVLGAQLAAERLADFDGVLVMGDGSSSRSEKAPGHLDDRAVPFDTGVMDALRGGDAVALADLDLQTAASVGAAGAVVWQALGGCVATVDEAEVLAVDDQYGVLYVVATWHAQWAGRARHPA